MAILVDDELMYFYLGKPQERIPISLRRKARKEKEVTMFKIQGNYGDHHWMHKCSQCGLHFFEDEDSGIAETGVCKKCREDESELEKEDKCY